MATYFIKNFKSWQGNDQEYVQLSSLSHRYLIIVPNVLHTKLEMSAFIKNAENPISQLCLLREDRLKMDVFIKHPQGLKAFEAMYMNTCSSHFLGVISYQKIHLRLQNKYNDFVSQMKIPPICG